MSTPGMHGPQSDRAALNAEMERLWRRNIELEGLVEVLERFTYVASHDLQEPLRTITAYTELTIKKCSGVFDDEALSYMQRVVEGAGRMRDLLSDLLAYADVSAHHEPEDTVDLDAVIEGVIQNLKPVIEECGALLTSEHLPKLRARQSDFIRLFQNLFANAIKYRGSLPPWVHVSMRREGSDLQFAVSDNGIGIAPQYHRRIFEPFQRLHSKDVPGTGLGLSICERVIKRYGGRIWVESEAGSGATFVFVIPDISIG